MKELVLYAKLQVKLCLSQLLKCWITDYLARSLTNFDEDKNAEEKEKEEAKNKALEEKQSFEEMAHFWLHCHCHLFIVLHCTLQNKTLY